MKPISKFFIFNLVTITTTAAGGATITPWHGPESYLNNAAASWANVFSNIGPSGEIATYIRDDETADIARFIDTVEKLGYNDTALNLFETTRHLNHALDMVGGGPSPRRAYCPTGNVHCIPLAKTLVIEIDAFAATDDYDSDKNSDFKSNTGGGTFRARGYVTDGFSFGIAYTTNRTKTHKTPVRTKMTGNSVTLFTQYIGKSGIFMNIGANAGTARWTTDKVIAGVPNDGAYNSDFWAGQINMGLKMSRGDFAITPQMGARYARVNSDKHVDDAAQSFDEWWYNTLTGMAGVNMEYNFMSSDTIFRPWLRVGGTYDAISNGTNAIRVTLISGDAYAIPIDAPRRLALAAGAGFDIQYDDRIAFGAEYKLDMRQDYTSHAGIVNIKAAF